LIELAGKPAEDKINGKEPEAVMESERE